MDDSSESERREVLFSGRVQGVGFRYTTREVARRFAVTGFVTNLPDGRVRLVAEGKPAELDRFVQAVSEAMERYIGHVETERLPVAGEFADFSIRL